jgi:hypothetical protein
MVVHECSHDKWVSHTGIDSCFAEAASSEVYPVSAKVYFDQLLPTRDGDYYIF